METGFAFSVLSRYDSRVDEVGILNRMQRNHPNCPGSLRLSYATEKFARPGQLPAGVIDLLWKGSPQPFFADDRSSDAAGRPVLRGGGTPASAIRECHERHGGRAR